MFGSRIRAEIVSVAHHVGIGAIDCLGEYIVPHIAVMSRHRGLEKIRLIQLGKVLQANDDEDAIRTLPYGRCKDLELKQASLFGCRKEIVVDDLKEVFRRAGTKMVFGEVIDRVIDVGDGWENREFAVQLNGRLVI
jgi:hypothetical protein